jgi:hypothetical protein
MTAVMPGFSALARNSFHAVCKILHFAKEKPRRAVSPRVIPQVPTNRQTTKSFVCNKHDDPGHGSLRNRELGTILHLGSSVRVSSRTNGFGCQRRGKEASQ